MLPTGFARRMSGSGIESDRMTRADQARIDERSGVLHPENLARYHARRFEAHRDIAEVVDHFWQVRWHLDSGEVISQRIIDAAGVHLTVEEGAVPAPLRSEEHTSELQSRENIVCRLLLEKKKKKLITQS